MARRKRGPDKHLVHGEWMTEAEAAARLGRSVLTVRQWRYKNRREGGKHPALLVEAWDHYSDLNAGRIKPGNGHSAKMHKVAGRMMTRDQAAEALGIPVGTLDSHMHNHRCGLGAAWRYYTRKRARRAEKRILEIINGK